MINYNEEMLKVLREMLSFNTVKGEETENAPFGEENLKCLTRFLEIGENYGFSSKSVDNFAGHVEWTAGEEILGVLGHLDIVPAGEGWTQDPFKGEIVDGFVYGRGVQDDKGPMIASLIAMKKLKDEGFTPKKTIRLIVGCNEENGSSCIRHYLKHEKMPTVGFSPDADFPCIHSEKGILWVEVKGKAPLMSVSKIFGGEKTNMVPYKCVAEFSGLSLASDRNVEVSGNKLTTYGKNAHGSTPEKGINSVFKLLKFINKFERNDTVQYIIDTFEDTSGEGAKIKAFDETSGALTLNLGTLSYDNGEFTMSLDIRYPVNTSKEQILKTFEENAPKNVTFSVLNHQEKLYVNPSDPLVTTLVSIYNKHTGENAQSKKIGGGTYARELDYGVAFGPIFEGSESTIHDKDERMELSQLEKLIDIYYDAIVALSQDFSNN